MKKPFSSIVLLIILLMPAALAVVSSIQLASAADNVTTINDFTCNVTKGTIPLPARLTADVSGEVTNWLWAFHNTQFNKSSYSSSPGTTKHTFGRTGVYGVFNVTLVVSGPNGNATMKKIAYVVANKNITGLPVAAFTASTTIGNAPLTVSFTDNSNANTTSHIWYFGNKATSTEQNPTHTFNVPGKYRVVEVVNNTNGWDAIAQEIVVQGEQQESVLPEPDFEADTSNGLIVQFTDLAQNGNAFNWDFGDETNSTEYSPAHTYAASGEYTVNLTVSNENGINSVVKTISVEEASSSSNESDDSDDGGSSHSSGGSSGGVAGSPEPQTNVETKETSQVFIANGNPVNYTFPQAVTPIMNINFDAKKTVGKTTAIVEMLKNQSTLVSEPPSDDVYKFVNIWIGTGGFASSKNLENATIDFKAEKSWMQDDSIDKSSIVLNRYNDTKWEQLKTSLIGEDDKYLYFTAETPGFSSFTITGTKAAVEEAQPVSAIIVEQNNTSNETSVDQPQISSSAKQESKKSPGFEMVYGILGVFTAFVYKRK